MYLKTVLTAGKEDRDKAFEIYECWPRVEPANFNLLLPYAMGISIQENMKEHVKSL
jgi:hypothetical protein